MGHELGHRQADRLTAQLERVPLGELLLPVDALFVAFRLELALPVVAVEVEHLVAREPVSVLEHPPEVGR